MIPFEMMKQGRRSRILSLEVLPPHPKDAGSTVQHKISGAKFMSFTLNKNKSERVEP